MNVMNNYLFKIVVKILMEKNIKRSIVAIQISQKNQAILLHKVSNIKLLTIQTQIAFLLQVETSQMM